MNASVISSTYQEIGGTPDSVGQYEPYKCFTMPELYHVVNGLSYSVQVQRSYPGVNENYYFPTALSTEDRIPSDRTRVEGNAFHPWKTYSGKR